MPKLNKKIHQHTQEIRQLRKRIEQRLAGLERRFEHIDRIGQRWNHDK